MKNHPNRWLLGFFLVMMTLAVIAANPTFQSFNTNQFHTTATSVSIANSAAITNITNTRTITGTHASGLSLNDSTGLTKVFFDDTHGVALNDEFGVSAIGIMEAGMTVQPPTTFNFTPFTVKFTGGNTALLLDVTTGAFSKQNWPTGVRMIEADYNGVGSWNYNFRNPDNNQTVLSYGTAFGFTVQGTNVTGGLRVNTDGTLLFSGVGTFSANQTLNGTDNEMPNQTLVGSGTLINYNLMTNYFVQNTVPSYGGSLTNMTLYAPTTTNGVTFSDAYITASSQSTNYIVDLTNAVFQRIYLTANLNIQASTNRPSGTNNARVCTVKIYPNGSDRTLAINSSWHVAGGNTIYATLTNNTIGYLSLMCDGASETNVTYTYQAAP